MLHSEVAYLDFSPEQSKAITFASQTIADLGGPEAKGVALQARIFADQLEQALSEDQRALLQRFNEGRLSALMNPANEPTNVFPLREIIERLGSLDTLALTSTSFDFTRSDCFAHGQGNAG